MAARLQQKHQLGGSMGEDQHHHQQPRSTATQATLNDLYTRINTVIEQYGGYCGKTQKPDIVEEHLAASQRRQAHNGSPVKMWKSLTGNRSYTFVDR
ncbi:hypothetical protein LTR37_005650 [Vermiconidia calcicola]|uniref:Uncharacterized protein n=1 Tax=Vermiconidia calcicola TaxID=1690605 RepID=A0ACC3NIA4_9PEZI|nr:hypothetical protein LTR37_005650 [Vermiconidia calcicola]